jgi:hypothetical protein
VPDYTNENTRHIKEKLPPFSFPPNDELENDTTLVKKGPIDVSNGIIYVG